MGENSIDSYHDQFLYLLQTSNFKILIQMKIKQAITFCTDAHIFMLRNRW